MTSSMQDGRAEVMRILPVGTVNVRTERQTVIRLQKNASVK